jgi:hypothetical protein
MAGHRLPRVTKMPVAGRASGVGSWPGADALEAGRTSFGELGEPPHVPFLPELPDRGPGADLIGRAAGLLVDLPVDLQPSGWRLVDHPGRDLSRTAGWLRHDLDVLAEVADGYSGPLKLQVAGPWTLAASLWLPRLERAVVDPGACRDLVGSLAEGVARHVAEVAGVLPGAELILQLDEPSLSGVLSGSIPTASGFGRLRAVDEQVVVDGLAAVLQAAVDAGAGTVVHCCATAPPVSLLVRAGAAAISVDVGRLGEAGWEQVALAVEDGIALWAGAVPVTDPAGAGGGAEAGVDAGGGITGPWQKLGLDPSGLAGVVVTPTCGLASLSPAAARRVLIRTKRTAAALVEQSEA